MYIHLFIIFCLIIFIGSWNQSQLPLGQTVLSACVSPRENPQGEHANQIYKKLRSNQ